MEKKFLAKNIVVKLYCDECNEEMEYLDTMNGPFMSFIYRYKCPKCGKIVDSTIKYPYYDVIATNTPVLDRK